MKKTMKSFCSQNCTLTSLTSVCEVHTRLQETECVLLRERKGSKEEHKEPDILKKHPSVLILKYFIQKHYLCNCAQIHFHVVFVVLMNRRGPLQVKMICVSTGVWVTRFAVALWGQYSRNDQTAVAVYENQNEIGRTFSTYGKLTGTTWCRSWFEQVVWGITETCVITQIKALFKAQAICQ